MAIITATAALAGSLTAPPAHASGGSAHGSIPVPGSACVVSASASSSGSMAGSPVLDGGEQTAVTRRDLADGRVELTAALSAEEAEALQTAGCAWVPGAPNALPVTISTRTSRTQTASRHGARTVVVVIVIVVGGGAGQLICFGFGHGRGAGLERVADRAEHWQAAGLLDLLRRWCSSPAPPPDVPEVPAPALLVLTAGITAGGVALIRRRSRAVPLAT